MSEKQNFGSGRVFDMEVQPDGSFVVPGAPEPIREAVKTSLDPIEVAREAVRTFNEIDTDYSHRLSAFDGRLAEAGFASVSDVDTVLGKQFEEVSRRVASVIDDFNALSEAYDSEKAEKYPQLVQRYENELRNIVTLIESVDRLLRVAEHDAVIDFELNAENIHTLTAKRQWLAYRLRDVQQFKAYARQSFQEGGLEQVFPQLYKELIEKVTLFEASVDGASNMFGDSSLPTGLLLNRVKKTLELRATILGIIEQFQNVIDSKPVAATKMPEDTQDSKSKKKELTPFEKAKAAYDHLTLELTKKAQEIRLDITAEMAEISQNVTTYESLNRHIAALIASPHTVPGIIEQIQQRVDVLKKKLDDLFKALQGRVIDEVIEVNSTKKKAPLTTGAPGAAATPGSAKPFALKEGAAVNPEEARRLLAEIAGKTAVTIDEARVYRSIAKESWRHAKPAYDQAEAEYQRLFAEHQDKLAAAGWRNKVEMSPELRKAQEVRNEARTLYQQTLSASQRYRESEVEFRARDLPGMIAAAESEVQAAQNAVIARVKEAQPGIPAADLGPRVMSDAGYKAAHEKLSNLKLAQIESNRRLSLRTERVQNVVRHREQKPDGVVGDKKTEQVTFSSLPERLQSAVRKSLIDVSLANEQKSAEGALARNPGVLKRVQERFKAAFRNPDGTLNKSRVVPLGVVAMAGLGTAVALSPVLLASIPAGIATKYLTNEGLRRLGKKLIVSGKETQLQHEKKQSTRDIFSGDVTTMASTQRNLQSAIETRTKWVNRVSEGISIGAGIAAGYGTKVGLENSFPNTFSGITARAAVLAPDGSPVDPPPPPQQPPAQPTAPPSEPPRVYRPEPRPPFEINPNRVADLARNLDAPTPAPPSAPPVAAEQFVEVRRGNVLSRLLHEQMIAAQERATGTRLDPTARRELSRLMYERFPEMRGADGIRATTPPDRWTLTPEQWHEVGVRSRNPNLLQPGERINVGRLLEIMNGRQVVAPGEVPIQRTNPVDFGRFNEVTFPPSPDEVRTYEVIAPYNQSPGVNSDLVDPLPGEVPQTPPSAAEVRTYEVIAPYNQSPGVNSDLVDPLPGESNPNDPVITGQIPVARAEVRNIPGSAPESITVNSSPRAVVVDRANLDDQDFRQFVNREFGSEENFIRRRDSLIESLDPRPGFWNFILNFVTNDFEPVHEVWAEVPLSDLLADERTPAQVVAALQEADSPRLVEAESVARWRQAIPRLIERLEAANVGVDRDNTTLAELINAATADGVTVR